MNDQAVPLIDSRSSYFDALRWGFATASSQDARRIVCADGDFADWPLDDTALLDGLAAWLRRPQRRLVLLARSYDEVPRRFPRFVQWRRLWLHAIDCWQAPDELASDLPRVLADDTSVSVHLIDAVHWRGRASLERRRARLWCEEIDVVLQRSERAFAANTLGL